MSFRIRPLSFSEGETIPARYTGDGENLSPALAWDDPPSGTRSFALVVDDPDAPTGTFTHWLRWDIPGSLRELPEGVLSGTLGHDGVNDFGQPAYVGPCPPKGHGSHRYQFKLYALDTSRLMLPEGAKRFEFDKALHGHDLEESWATGRYERS